MKKHECSRCHRHVSNVVEVARKSGSIRSLCTDCIELQERKGAKPYIIRPAADERRRARQKKAAGDNR